MTPDPAARSTVSIRLALWLGWAVALLAVYYTQLWLLLAAGPAGWDRAAMAVLLGLPPASAHATTEALARAALGLFGAAAVLLAAQAPGAWICRALGWTGDNWRERLAFRTAAGLGAISYLSLLLAGLGVYRPRVVQAMVAALAGAALVQLLAARRARPPAARSSVPSPAPGRPWRIVIGLSLLVSGIAALAPEVEYDALWYHLELPRAWLAHGRPVDRIQDYISLYPLTWELIFGAGLAAGNAVSARLLHFACLPLLAAVTWELTRRFVPAASPWLAAALVTATPIVLWEASTAYVDLALALHVWLCAYALLRYDRAPDRSWLALAVLNMGLALATKHLALVILAIFSGALLARLWRTRSLRPAVATVALFAALSLLFPLPWYVRGWVAAGNPVFPELYWLFGAWPAERWDALTEEGLRGFKGRFGDDRTPLNLLLLPWNATVHAARYGGTLGPLFLLLIPALAVFRRRSPLAPWLLGFAVLYVAVWASPVSSFQMRFLVPLVPALAVLAADAAARLAASVAFLRPQAAAAFHAALSVLLALNLPPFTPLHERDRVEWDGWLTHVIRMPPVHVVAGRETEEAYIGRHVRSYAAWQHINRELPPDVRVFTFSGGDHFYSDRPRLWVHATMARPAARAIEQGSPAQAVEALRRLGITHVLFDKREMAAMPEGSDAREARMRVLDRLAGPDYEDGGFVLYWVP